MQDITIPGHIFDDMIAYCREGHPNEVCGILGGRGNSVSGIWKIRNVEASPVSFLMDPKQQFQAMKSLRNEGLSMVGLFHSHPDSAAYPSARDVALVFYDDTAHIIVSLIGEEPQAKAFFIMNGTVEEIKMNIVKTT